MFRTAVFSFICFGVGLLVSPAAGNTWYAAPFGRPAAFGTRSDPWDLQTALNKVGIVRAGDTLYLLGGVYRGKFYSRVSGAPGAPILITSNPGEWARIDGYAPVTLQLPVTPNATTVMLSDTRQAVSGGTVRMDQEMMYVKTAMGNVVSVVRGWNGTKPVLHMRGVGVMFVGSVMYVGGGNVFFRDLEIMSSDPARRTQIPGSEPIDIQRGTGFNVQAAGVKLINVVVHDTGDAIGFSTAARDSEISGALLYSNGWQGPDRGHGHGIYIQNQTSQKYVNDVISFDNYATGMKTFGYKAYGNNVHYDGNTVFGNHEGNFFAGVDRNPMQNVTVDHLYVYAPPGAHGGGGAVFGWAGVQNQDVSITNSYIAGRTSGLNVKGWASAKVTGNTFAIWGGTAVGNNLVQAAPNTGLPPSAFIWDRNTYFDGSARYANGLTYNFTYSKTFNALGGGNLAFDEDPTPRGEGWRQWTGYDANSTWVNARPSGTRIFVRANKYEQGRGTIIIYNWDNKSSVLADVSAVGLTAGDAYEVKDAQNFFGPTVAKGTYDGSAIDIPMQNLPVYTAVGSVAFPPVHTPAEFGVFILRKAGVPKTRTHASVLR